MRRRLRRGVVEQVSPRDLIPPSWTPLGAEIIMRGNRE
jgi:hypothetical protein